MALELTIFMLILGASALLYLAGMIFKIPHLFLFGCVLLFGSGALLWGSGGLITSYYYDVAGVLVANVLSMSNIGLAMFALSLVGIPIISVLTIELNPSVKKSKSPFHF